MESLEYLPQLKTLNELSTICKDFPKGFLTFEKFKTTVLIPGNYYHVFNHANGTENLFTEPKNCFFFLEKTSLYILPFVKLHAYCLLPNHFHFLVYVKDLEELKILSIFRNYQNLSEENFQMLVEKKVSKSFSNLFSCYSQSFNKIYGRKGSLFIPNMKQISINTTNDICKIVHYIHSNPVHHGFVKRIEDWKFSSYKTYLSDSDTKLARNEIIEIFGSRKYLIEYHQQPIELKLNWD